MRSCPIVAFPTSVLSKTLEKEICLNFYIITKNTSQESESAIYKKQKILVLNQLSQTQHVFENNRDRHCPIIRFSPGVIKQVSWKEALRLSQPVDKGIDETLEAYQFRKLGEASDELQLITAHLNEEQKLSYRSFLELRPGPVRPSSWTWATGGSR